jgi:hypothetical protein
MSDHKDTSANMTLDRIDMIFSKQGDIEIYKTVKEFFNTIVKPRIDEISKKEKYTIKTFSRFAELSKNFV